jgi:hypothetical protein
MAASADRSKVASPAIATGTPALATEPSVKTVVPLAAVVIPGEAPRRSANAASSRPSTASPFQDNPSGTIETRAPPVPSMRNVPAIVIAVASAMRTSVPGAIVAIVSVSPAGTRTDAATRTRPHDSPETSPPATSRTEHPGPASGRAPSPVVSASVAVARAGVAQRRRPGVGRGGRAFAARDKRQRERNQDGEASHGGGTHAPMLCRAAPASEPGPRMRGVAARRQWRTRDKRRDGAADHATAASGVSSRLRAAGRSSTLTSFETPGVSIVTPYSTSAICIVRLLCVIRMNCECLVIARTASQ